MAIDAAEAELGAVQVRGSASQASTLIDCATVWPERTWAVEGADGHSNGRA